MEDNNNDKRKRLTKKPPQKNQQHQLDNASSNSSRSSGSLNPSSSFKNKNKTSSTYSRKQNPLLLQHNNFNHSSNCSLDRQSLQYSPVLGDSSSQSFSKRFSTHSRPLSGQTPEEFVGAPFDGTGILKQIDSQIDANKAVGYQNSLRRPPPPPLSHTSPSNPHIMSPKLRQVASFSADSEKIARVAENQLIIPKRYSDEKEPKSAVLKKKGFSGFMSGLVGSPRRVNISAPENPVHVTHVGFDSNTGQFTVWNTGN